MVAIPVVSWGCVILYHACFMFMKFHFLILVMLVTSGTAFAQGGRGGVELQGAASAAGVNGLRPGYFGEVAVRLKNASGEDAVVRPTVSAAGVEGLASSAEVWVPGGSQRRAVFSFWTPAEAKGDAGNERSVGLTTRLIRGESRETQGAALPGVAVRLADKGLVTATLSDDSEAGITSWLRGLLEASQVSRAEKMVSVVRPASAPRTAAGWDAVNVMGLGLGEGGLDAARSLAVRRWVQGGGVLVVDSTATPDAVLGAVLGEAWDLTRLGETRWTELRWSDRGRALERAYPVRRVLVDERAWESGRWSVVQRVNGEPVILDKPMGQGRVMVLLLEPRAWWAEADQVAVDAGGASVVWPGSAVMSAASAARGSAGQGRLEEGGDAGGFDADAEARDAVSAIGYSVLDGRVAVGLLALLPVGIGVAGWWFGRSAGSEGSEDSKRSGDSRGLARGREWASVASVVLALGVTGLVIGAGVWSRGGTPDTVSSVGSATVRPGSSTVVVEGVAAVYRSGDGSGHLTGASSVPRLKTPGLDEGLVRVVWEDLDRWRLETADARVGAVRTVGFRSLVDLGGPVSGRLMVGGGGLKVEAAGIPSGLGSMTLVVPGGRAEVTRGEGGVMRVGAMEALEGGQLHAGPGWKDGSAGGVLEGWLEGLDVGLSLGEGTRRVGRVRLTLPLSVEVSAGEGLVTLPGGLLGRRVVGTVYAANEGEWLTTSAPNKAEVRYRLPGALAGSQAVSAVWVVDVEAPSRRWSVEVFEGGGGQADRRNQRAQRGDAGWRTAGSGTGLVGERRFELSATEGLRVVDGEVGLRLSVGQVTGLRGGDPPSWTVGSVRLESLTVRVTDKELP